MRFEEKIVTPEDAKKWLENRAPNNRPISDKTVKNYARQMEEGWWQDVPQVISFNIEGKLIDGQHRLAAIVTINKPVKLNIIWDAPPQSFYIIDMGLPRRPAFIANIPTFASQCYTLLMSMATKYRPSPNDLKMLNDLLKSNIDLLHKTSARKLRFWGSSPIRAAALVSLAIGEDPSSTILNKYDYLSKGVTDGAPSIISKFIDAYHAGHLIERKNTAGDYLRRDIYIRARYVFDGKNETIRNWPQVIGDIQYSNYIQEAKLVVRRALGEHLKGDLIAADVQKKLGETLQGKTTISRNKVLVGKALGRIIDAEQSRLSQLAKD